MFLFLICKLSQLFQIRLTSDFCYHSLILSLRQPNSVNFIEQLLLCHLLPNRLKHHEQLIKLCYLINQTITQSQAQLYQK